MLADRACLLVHSCNTAESMQHLCQPCCRSHNASLIWSSRRLSYAHTASQDQIRLALIASGNLQGGVRGLPKSQPRLTKQPPLQPSPDLPPTQSNQMQRLHQSPRQGRSQRSRRLPRRPKQSPTRPRVRLLESIHILHRPLHETIPDTLASPVYQYSGQEHRLAAIHSSVCYCHTTGRAMDPSAQSASAPAIRLQQPQ